MRGRSFVEMDAIFTELSEPARTKTEGGEDADRKRIAIMHAGGPAPGMNTAARAAVRLGISRGHTVIGIHNGFVGLAAGDMAELAWSDVEGWAGEGGAGAGTRPGTPRGPPAAKPRAPVTSTPSAAHWRTTTSTPYSSSADTRPTRASTP